MTRASLIVAMTPAGLIGRDGDLPWRFSEDLKHFKRTTLGQTVLMGRRTWESLGRPLPGRTNVVVSRRVSDPAGEERDGAHWFPSLPAALSWVGATRPDASDHVWVIGGGQLYADVLGHVDGAGDAPLHVERLVVTWVPELPGLEGRDGDVHFPRDADWIERHFEVTERRRGEDERLLFVDYRRRG